MKFSDVVTTATIAATSWAMDVATYSAGETREAIRTASCAAVNAAPPGATVDAATLYGVEHNIQWATRGEAWGASHGVAYARTRDRVFLHIFHITGVAANRGIRRDTSGASNAAAALAAREVVSDA